MWKVFLSRFKFVQELVGMTQDLTTKQEPETNKKISPITKNRNQDIYRKRRVRLE